MNKTILLICVFILVSVGMAFGFEGLCYQETANDSSVTSTNPTLANGDCALDFSGNYDTSEFNWTDGDWSTKDNLTSDTYYINYTSPSNALNSSLWQVKDETSLEVASINNISLNVCALNNTYLELKIFSDCPLGRCVIYWACRDKEGNFDTIRTLGGSAGDEQVWVYEESIWWDIGVVPSFSNNQTNASSTTYNGTTVQINLTIKDESNISAYILTHNDTTTGIFTNETIVNLAGDGNVTMIWNYSIINFPLRGGTFGWRVWANDTFNNVNESETHTFVVPSSCTDLLNNTLVNPSTTYCPTPSAHFSYSVSSTKVLITSLSTTDTLNISFENIGTINQIFNGTSTTPTAEDITTFNEVIPPQNRTLVFLYSTTTQPKFSEIAITISDMNYTYSGNILTLGCTGTGSIKLTNMDILKGTHSFYSHKKDGVLQGYSRDNDFTISDCSSHTFQGTTPPLSFLSQISSTILRSGLAVILAIFILIVLITPLVIFKLEVQWTTNQWITYFIGSLITVFLIIALIKEIFNV